VNSIFERLTLVYGHDFLRRWEGLDLAAVKASWAEELAGLHTNSAAIKHALAHLPAGQPPTVIQFRALCIARPEPEQKLLNSPRASSELVAALVAKALEAVAPAHGVEWAHRLRRREQQAERLTAAQRAMLRQALRGQHEAAEA
jgi:hypothetical protein